MKTIETKTGFLVTTNSYTNVQMRLAAGRVCLISQPPEDPERLDVGRFLDQVRALEGEIETSCIISTLLL